MHAVIYNSMYMQCVSSPNPKTSTYF